MAQRKFAAGVPAGGRQDNQSSSHLFAIDGAPYDSEMVRVRSTDLYIFNTKYYICVTQIGKTLTVYNTYIFAVD